VVENYLKMALYANLVQRANNAKIRQRSGWTLHMMPAWRVEQNHVGQMAQCVVQEQRAINAVIRQEML